MEIDFTKAHQYSERYTSPEDDILKDIAAYTEANHAQAHMLSGHLQGRLLSMISKLLQPRRILEIGTFTGYSALCLAEGLSDDGELHTIELRESEAVVAQGYFQKRDVKRIILHVGEALEIIGELDETWDLVFLDADKVNYVNYFKAVFPKLRKNGVILADNVLFHGEVFEAEIKGKNAKAIQAFNDFINERSDVEKLMLPIRDGVYLIRKL